MFREQDREHTRSGLVLAARTDLHIIAAAHLGSMALNCQDQWSDIDLALCLVDDADYNEILADWTRRLYTEHAAVIHHDVRRGPILYRVFLLANTLQVDLSFWKPTEFRGVGPQFSLIFGLAGEPIPAPLPDSMELIGMGWLHGLHVRSSIARGRFLQADQMLAGMRDNALALACKRSKVSTVQGRGLDDLPEELRIRAADCRARCLDASELKRAFRTTTDLFLDEIQQADGVLASKLAAPLNTVANDLLIEGGDASQKRGETVDRSSIPEAG